MMRVGVLTTILLLSAASVTGEEVSELPKSMCGHYAVWASIEKNGEISAKVEKKELPLFFVGPRHAVTIGVGTIFERIEKTEVGSRTIYTCHPHAATGEQAPKITIENLGGGVLLFSENGGNLLCKKSSRTLGLALKTSPPEQNTASTKPISTQPAKSADGHHASQAK